MNIKEKGYMWGSHFQRDSDHHGGGGLKASSDDGVGKWIKDRSTHVGAGNRGSEVQAGRTCSLTIIFEASSLLTYICQQVPTS